jgi:hypothetical protein
MNMDKILGAQAFCLLIFEIELIPKASRQDACAPSIFRGVVHIASDALKK